MAQSFLFTSESVSEGHPDKVCDFLSDSILDAHLEQDIHSRVACETLCKNDRVLLAGEITSHAEVDVDRIVRDAIREIGYTDSSELFSADGVEINTLLTLQAREIAQGVDRQGPAEQGAGDQGIMFGYATDETPELMPLPILLAHRLAFNLAQFRKSGDPAWIRPDSKTQVTVRYEDGQPVEVTDVLVSTQHTAAVDQAIIHDFVYGTLAPDTLGPWWRPDIRVIVNPTGSFVEGGPATDCGLTGRKIIADTYGGFGRHGGGAFSGKDPSKVDRSGAYFCRFVARELVLEGIVSRAEIQVSYAIGVAKPISIYVNTFGTGDVKAAGDFVRSFDFRPGAIIERLDLLQPIYRKATNYGHFGRRGLPWEESDGEQRVSGDGRKVAVLP